MANSAPHMAIVVPLVSMLGGAVAAEPPSSSIVHNTENRAQLVINCEEINSSRVTCQMRESDVSLKLDPSKLDAAIESGMSQISSDAELREMVEVACNVVGTLTEALTSEEPAHEQFQSLTDSQRDNINIRIAMFSEICEEQTVESVRSFIEYQATAETRTCVINSRSWRLDFERRTDDVWTSVNTDIIGGTCGVVTLDRLERHNNSRFWNYVSRSIASNPNNIFFGDTRCADAFDGEETKFQFHSGPFPLRCDYVKFDTNY